MARPRQKTCKRGHSLNKWGVSYTVRPGVLGRRCTLCLSIRRRKSYHRKVLRRQKKP